MNETKIKTYVLQFKKKHKKLNAAGNDGISYLTSQSTYEMSWDINYASRGLVTYTWKYFNVASEKLNYRLTVSSALPSTDGIAIGFQVCLGKCI